MDLIRSLAGPFGRRGGSRGAFPRVVTRMASAACVASALIALLGGAGAASADDGGRRGVKRLFAGPDDVKSGAVVLPAAELTPTTSRVAFLRAAIDTAARENPAHGEARLDFVHAGGAVRLFVLGAGALAWEATLESDTARIELAADEDAGRAHDGTTVAWKVGVAEVSQSVIGIDEPARMFDLELPAGATTIRLRTPREHVGRRAVVMVADPSADSLSAYLAHRVVRAGAPCEIVVRGVDGSLPGLPSARAISVDDASIRWGDGTIEPAAVGVRGDGAVSVVFPRARRGDAVAWIEGTVVGQDGARRRRTIHYPLRVAPDGTLAAPARLEPSGSHAGWIDVLLPVDGLDDRSTVFAAAELWAVRQGEAGGHPDRCMGWVGGLAELETVDGRAMARIGVEAAALALSDGESLALREVRIHERDGFAPIDWMSSVAAESDEALARLLHAPRSPDDHPKDAAWCGRPTVASVEAVRRSSLAPGVGSHALALAHGYCADANTWPTAHFSGDAYLYLNPNQNLSHDAFALDLADRCDQFKSYGVVAHSQGGSAALHLLTFYWSGLDWAGPGRLVQTVGTPFEGTALAGNVAALGEIFGIQCGATFDMTYDGAAAWLSTIPTAARARVFTHTTTFTNVPFFYDYCNILSDVLLTDPEDGVVEHSSGHIVGANDMGLRSGWCHVAGMRDPDQTLDASRNSVMNAQGAR